MFGECRADTPVRLPAALRMFGVSELCSLKDWLHCTQAGRSARPTFVI
jgi:hypothetical protein